jgi:hypothetical protein
MEGPDRSRRLSVSPPASPAGFWVLIVLSALVFVPCVILPVWRDYQAMVLAVQVEEHLTAVLRADVEGLRHSSEAIRTDPGVAARLARRELSYRHPGQTDVVVPGVVPAGFEASPGPTLEPVPPPAPVARVLGRLPAIQYDRLFREEPTRSILMLLSGGLAVAAFVLYAPKPRRRSVEIAEPSEPR